MGMIIQTNKQKARKKNKFIIMGKYKKLVKSVASGIIWSPFSYSNNFGQIIKPLSLFITWDNNTILYVYFRKWKRHLYTKCLKQGLKYQGNQWVLTLMSY